MKCGNSNDLIHKDVVIIGNGPSGIALSYMLSGHIPYVTSATHPDELLSIRLEPVVKQSLVDVNLPFLSNGLEGRTTNPVSLLLDSLVHPCADIGLEMDPLVEWRQDGQMFRKFGHICEIQTGDHEMTNIRSRNPLRRWFNRLRMINETYQRSYSFLRSQKKIMNEHKKLLEHPYIIHPFSNFRTTWEIIMCFIYLFQTVMIPMDIAFFSIEFEYNMVRSKSFEVVRIFTDVISLLDIVITFFSGYCDTDQNKIIVNPTRIAKHYLSRTFLLDVFASIPFDVILNKYEAEDQSSRALEWFFIGHYIALLKLLRYYNFVVYTARIFDATMTEIYYVVHRISIAFITFILYLHVVCCLCIGWNSFQLHFSYRLEDSHAIIKSYGSGISRLGAMYTRFFYSACLVVFNVGNGFTVYWNSAVLFTTNVWLCSRLLYILAIAYFIQLQASIHSSAQKYVDMLCEVRDYMKHRQIPNFLQNRILSYYDIKFQNCFFQEYEILNTVSAQLRQIDHVVLGKGSPGGSWHSMDPDILTLSLGSWMSLPGLKYESRNSSEKRASAKSVAEYYARYVQEMGLSQNFRNKVLVTKIEPFVGDESECKSKWVEKVNNDICQKMRLCSRPERKDLVRHKSYSLSNALNYIMNRGQERCAKRSWEQNDGRYDEVSNDQRDAQYTVRKKRDKDRSVSSSSACEFSCDKCNLNSGHNMPSVPAHRLKYNCCDSSSRTPRWIVEAINLDTKACVRYTCNNLVLANGSSDLPNKLNISKYKTDPYWLLHDLRSLEIELDLHLQTNPNPYPVLVVGAGLSAADAIIATKSKNVPVVHLFRNKTDLTKQLPENMYPEYHKVHQMMKNGSNYPLYTALAEYTLTSLDEYSRKATITSKEGKSLEISVSYVVVLIGSRPDLGFLPGNFNLGVKKQLPIDGKKNTANIDKFTHQVHGHEGLYAIGPLAGDNFVRFLPGGALAVLSDIVRKRETK